MEESLASRMLMTVARSPGAMARYCIFGCLYTKQKRQNGALSIEIAEEGVENDCRAHWSCWRHICIAVGGGGYREDNAFFQDILIDNDDLKVILLTLPSRPSVFPRQLLNFLWSSHLKSCSVAFFLDPQYEHILWRIYFDRPSVKISLNTLVLHSVTSRHLVPRCFGEFGRRIPQRQTESHHFSLYSGSYIISGICFE